MPSLTVRCSPAGPQDGCPCASGQSPSLGQGSLSLPLNRTWLSHCWPHWKRVEGMSWWMVLSSFWDRECKTSPSVTRELHGAQPGTGSPCTLPSHCWSSSRCCCVCMCSSRQGFGKAGRTPVPHPPRCPPALPPRRPLAAAGLQHAPPHAPKAPSCARNSLMRENVILPGPGLQGVMARCVSGFCLGVYGQLLQPGWGSRCCVLLASVSIRRDKYRPAPLNTPSLQNRFCKH